MSIDTQRQRGAGIVLALVLGFMPSLGHTAPKHGLNNALNQPFTYDASSVVFDYKNKTADFKNIVVSQGTTQVRAKRAHAVGLDNQDDGRWTFEDDVRINAAPRGTLRSNEAVVEVRNRLITSATATGHPAQFQQLSAVKGMLARGHADLIFYDVRADTVRLTGDAWLSYGQNYQISSPLLVYDIREQRVLATAQPNHRVHITIVPHQVPGKGHHVKPRRPHPEHP